MHTYMKKNERKMRTRRRILTIMAAFTVAISIFIVSGNHMRSHEVQASSLNHTETLYKSIRINAGDTLWSIADTYMPEEYDSKKDYIEEVKKINHITEKDIQTGSYIILPYTVEIEHTN